MTTTEPRDLTLEDVAILARNTARAAAGLAGDERDYQIMHEEATSPIQCPLIRASHGLSPEEYCEVAGIRTF